ncbi:MAG: hypothetical protein KDI13_09030 [Alphaproteobacteria bacterium]|nr:hypothetical protein [Alphaproteobacteria bacterium]
MGEETDKGLKQNFGFQAGTQVAGDFDPRQILRQGGQIWRDITRTVPGGTETIEKGAKGAKEAGAEAIDSGKFKYHMDRLESNLKDVPHDKLLINEKKPSEMIKFMQNALHNLGHSSVDATGKFSKQFAEDLNGYIVAKREERDTFSGYSDLKGVEKFSDLTGAHLQAIIDTLRDEKVLVQKNPKAIDALGKALNEVNNADVREHARNAGMDVPELRQQNPPAPSNRPTRRNEWGAIGNPASEVADNGKNIVPAEKLPTMMS